MLKLLTQQGSAYLVLIDCYINSQDASLKDISNSNALSILWSGNLSQESYPIPSIPLISNWEHFWLQKEHIPYLGSHDYFIDKNLCSSKF